MTMIYEGTHEHKWVPLKVMHLFATYAAIHDDLPIYKYDISLWGVQQE